MYETSMCQQVKVNQSFLELCTDSTLAVVLSEFLGKMWQGLSAVIEVLALHRVELVDRWSVCSLLPL